jgi:hypothetical protein
LHGCEPCGRDWTRRVPSRKPAYASAAMMARSIVPLPMPASTISSSPTAS